MYHLFYPVVHFVAFSVNDLGLIYKSTLFHHLQLDFFFKFYHFHFLNDVTVSYQ